MTRTVTLLAVFLLCMTSFGWANTNEEIETRLIDLFNQFRCPTCQGLSVKDSEAGFSVQIRNKIEEMLRAGASDDEIRAYFVERYGEWILRSPPKEGFNLLLWILPGIGIFAGLFVLLRISQKWVQKQRAEAREETPLSPEEAKILEADLTRFQNH
ncbi:MAG: cytochrome c-type biogenesis protein CcmH [SAR324 cluster bacterium]|nr:cytochrome c-type biogenesis protein CcmH [SAR324 cluster bacterium]